MVDLVANVKRSISLHVVHLCGNKICGDVSKAIKKKLKPHFAERQAEPQEK